MMALKKEPWHKQLYVLTLFVKKRIESTRQQTAKEIYKRIKKEEKDILKDNLLSLNWKTAVGCVLSIIEGFIEKKYLGKSEGK